VVEIWNEASGTTAVSRSNKSNNSLGFRGTEVFCDKNCVKYVWNLIQGTFNTKFNPSTTHSNSVTKKFQNWAEHPSQTFCYKNMSISGYRY